MGGWGRGSGCIAGGAGEVLRSPVHSPWTLCGDPSAEEVEGTPGSVSGGSALGLLGRLPHGHLPPLREDKGLPWHPSKGGWDFRPLFPADTCPLSRCRGPRRPHRSNHHHSSQEHQRGDRDLGGDHGVRGQCQVGSAPSPL